MDYARNPESSRKNDETNKIHPLQKQHSGIRGTPDVQQYTKLAKTENSMMSDGLGPDITTSTNIYHRIYATHPLEQPASSTDISTKKG
jgi:hypothetical protein